MDIALSTLLLIYLLLPGLTFRRFYYTAEFSKEYFKEAIPTLLIAIILPATFLHLFAWLFLFRWFSIDVEVLATLFSGTDSASELKNAFQNIHDNVGKIFFYLLFTCTAGGLAGTFFKFYVRKTKLDRKWKIFRFQNEWHYLFSGEILDFPNVPGEATDNDFTYVDILVETSEGPVIYMGVLADYYLSKTGGIDRIYLMNVRRRMLRDDNPKCYYTMPGQFFAVQFEKILNVHITYYSVEIEDKGLAASINPENTPLSNNNS